MSLSEDEEDQQPLRPHSTTPLRSRRLGSLPTSGCISKHFRLYDNATKYCFIDTAVPTGHHQRRFSARNSYSSSSVDISVPEDLELDVSCSDEPSSNENINQPQQHSGINTPISNFIQEQQVGFIRKRSSSLPRILPPIFDQSSDEDEDEIAVSLEVKKCLKKQQTGLQSTLLLCLLGNQTTIATDGSDLEFGRKRDAEIRVPPCHRCVPSVTSPIAHQLQKVRSVDIVYKGVCKCFSRYFQFSS